MDHGGFLIKCAACNALLAPSLVRMEQSAVLLTCAGCGSERALLSGPGCASVRAQKRRRRGALRRSPERVAPAAFDARVTPRQPDGGEPRTGPSSGEDLSLGVPEDRCPKCVSPRRSGATSCAACGLLFSRFVPGSLAPKAELARAWRELLGRWDDPRKHRELLGQAQSRNELDQVARLYRIHLARHPGDAAAERGVEQVIRIALVPNELARARPARKRGFRLISLAVLAFFVTFAVVAVVTAARVKSAGSNDPSRPSASLPSADSRGW